MVTPVRQSKYQFIVCYFVLDLKCPIRIPQTILSLCHWLSIYPGKNRNDTVYLLKKSCSKFLRHWYKPSSHSYNGDITFTNKSWINLIHWDYGGAEYRGPERKTVELNTFDSRSFESTTLFVLHPNWRLVVTTQFGNITIQSMSQLVWHLKKTLLSFVDSHLLIWNTSVQ